MHNPHKRPLLTAGEEIALARRVHGDDPADSLEARNELVMRNLGLVGKMVRFSMRRGSPDHDDLFSEGLLALIKAAAFYKPWNQPKAIRFTTYACKAIKNDLNKWLERGSVVQVPHYLQRPTTIEALQARRSPENRELINANLARARQAKSSVSLSHRDDGREDDRPDILPIDPRPPAIETLIAHEDACSIARALGQIAPLSAYVVAHRYGLFELEKKTLDELGAELNLTRDRIRRLEVKAIAELRSLLGKDAHRSCA
jgi:RNA polymerase nonessential primary-like sigma factor